jgi:NTE family protein
VKLSARPPARQVSHPVHGPVDLAFAALRTLLAGHDAYHLADEHTTARTVFVDTAKVDPMDFGIDRDEQHWLYESGRRAATAFLGRWETAA